jgi:hypothetical protein
VSAIAVGTGKNRLNTGVSRVPRPKPENRVRREAANAVRAMTISIINR